MKIQVILTQAGTIISDDTCSLRAATEIMVEVVKGLLPKGISTDEYYRQLQFNMDGLMKEMMKGEGVQLSNPATNAAFTFQILQPKREVTIQ